MFSLAHHRHTDRPGRRRRVLPTLLPLILGTLWLAGTARAATVRILLRSDLAPQSEISIAVINGAPNDDPADTQFVQEMFFTDPAADLIAGVEIARWEGAPAVSRFTVVVFATGASGGDVYGRRVIVDSRNGDVDAFVLLARDTRPSTSPALPAYWTPWLTDVDSWEIDDPIWDARACWRGYLADGIECDGDHCDNMRLHCKPLAGRGRASLIGPFDETSAPGDGACAAGLYKGVRCEGDFCGDLTVSCRRFVNGVHDCYDSPTVSDENDDARVDRFVDTSPNDDHYIHEIRCAGDHCDDKTLTMCKPSATLLGPVTVFDQPADTELCVAGSLAGGIELVPCPDADASPAETDDAIVTHRLDGRLQVPGTGGCIGSDSPDTGSDARIVDCVGAPTWYVDRWGMLRTISGPAPGGEPLCLGVRDAPRGATLDEGMTLELQDCGAARAWSVPGTPPAWRLPGPRLLISEIVAGPGVNQALELYNAGSKPVDLGGYELRISEGAPAGQSEPRTVSLSGQLAPGSTWVVVRDEPGVDPQLDALADLRSAALAFDGNQAITLVDLDGGVAVDSFGQTGVELPSFSDGITETFDVTLRRRGFVVEGDVDPHDAFAPTEEWAAWPGGTVSGLGAHVVVEPAAGAIPAVGDIAGGTSPLTLARDGDAIRLSWGASCLASDNDYAIYRGELGAPAGQQQPLACSTNGQRRFTLVPDPGSWYYLVVPVQDRVEGSHGRDSRGDQRSPAPNACRPQNVAPVCL